MVNEVKVTFNDIVTQVELSHPEGPIDLLRKAYQVAEAAHMGQLRISGEEYIVHPLGVAKILADLFIDPLTISAALLHDVVEDTSYTLQDIEKQFGPEIAFLVDGVTKLSRFEYKSKEEQQLENYRKMFLAMAKDVRVVLIKLADRLHNMRTLKYMSLQKQEEIAKETLEIFAPLAHRLGISNIKWELEDLSFRYLEPEKYYELVEKMKQKRQEREIIINDFITTLTEKLKAVDINADIQGRPKHFYSIHKKMIKDQKDLSQIYDLYAIRVIVDSIKDCYGTLGTVHSVWKPMPYRFKDYIAMPKSNMYQSLHTTVIGSSGQPVEIQIRTLEMHKTSEYGIAAHWRYKEGNKSGDKEFDQKLSWLRQFMEWQQDIKDPREFVDAVKLDVFTDEVFVFTPKGDVIDLPFGAVPIDFAYRIHTDIGNKCVGAKVNGKIVPLEYKLNNGDIVDIITSKQGNGPSRDWLNIVGSSETRSKIRQWFKKEKREENIAKGRELLEKECKRLGYEVKEVLKNERILEAAKKINLLNEDDMLASVGFGGVTLKAAMSKLIEVYQKAKNIPTKTQSLVEALAELKPKHKKSKASQGILVKGESGLYVRLARCCSPIPGDPIVGYITRGRGVSIHRIDCTNIPIECGEEYERLIDVSWDVESVDTFPVTVEITGVDRPALLTDIIMITSEVKCSVSSVNAKVLKNKTALITLNINIKDLNQLEYIMTKMRRVKDVFKVQRNTQVFGG